jgi:SET domain-containing protein
MSSGEVPNVPLYVRGVPGKGYATFAARSYLKGDLILQESPLVTVIGKQPYSQAQVEALLHDVSSLTQEKKETFFKLCNVFPEESLGVEVAIVRTNGFDIRDGVGSAVYATLARINHSCAPNARQEHMLSTGEERIVASRDIAAGEEVNISYINICQPISRRREQLLESYKFHCVCTSCSAHDSNPTMRRFFPNA